MADVCPTCRRPCHAGAVPFDAAVHCPRALEGIRGGQRYVAQCLELGVAARDAELADRDRKLGWIRRIHAVWTNPALRPRGDFPSATGQFAAIGRVLDGTFLAETEGSGDHG